MNIGKHNYRRGTRCFRRREISFKVV